MTKFICEVCNKEHDGSYGSGRFCSNHCRHIYIGRQTKHHVCNFYVAKHKRAPFGRWKCAHCEFIGETRQQLKDHNKKEHPEWCNLSHPSWNKGLTKETNEKVRNISNNFKNKIANGEIDFYWKGKHHSNETKKILSEKRTNFLKLNPDKHPWKNNDKFKSEPCEYLKNKLIENEINFVEEFTDNLWDRQYSIDIAFPNKKIGIEVNGNQHYVDNELTDYYKNREKYLNNFGWSIMNIHYYDVYKEETLNKIKDFLNKD